MLASGDYDILTTNTEVSENSMSLYNSQINWKMKNRKNKSITSMVLPLKQILFSLIWTININHNVSLIKPFTYTILWHILDSISLILDPSVG